MKLGGKSADDTGSRFLLISKHIRPLEFVLKALEMQNELVMLELYFVSTPNMFPVENCGGGN